MIDDRTAQMIEELKDWNLSEQERTLCYKIHSTPAYQPIPTDSQDSILVHKFIRKRNLKVKRSPVDRFMLIRDSINGDMGGNSTILDIGCNVGFFGFALMKAEMLSSQIYSYLGIDSDLCCIEAGKALAHYRNLEGIDFIGLSVFDLLPHMHTDGVQFNYCLFLSTYHHLIGEFGFKKARYIFGLLGGMCDVMFFDMGQKDEPNNESRAYWHDALPDSDPEFLIRHEVENFTNYTNIIKLGVSDVSGRKGRVLYRFDSD